MPPDSSLYLSEFRLPDLDGTAHEHQAAGFHWIDFVFPISCTLAFLRYEYGLILPLSVKLFALVGSFFLAILSWLLIEQPFRHRRLLQKPRQLMVATVLAPVLLMCVSFLIEENNGFPKRLPQEARNYLKPIYQNAARKYTTRVDPDDIREDKVPFHGDPSGSHEILVWGDSHAMAMMPGIDAVCQNLRIKCYQITCPGNTPLLGYCPPSDTHGHNRVVERNQAAYEFILRKKISLVIMIGYWGKTSQKHPSVFQKSVRATIGKFDEKGVQAVIIEDNASFNYHVPTHLATRVLRRKDVSKIGISLEDHYEFNRVPRESFRSLTNKNVRVYDPTPYFTEESNLWLAQINGDSMVRDRHHLSVAGSLRLKPLIKRGLLESIPRIASGTEQKRH